MKFLLLFFSSVFLCKHALAKEVFPEVLRMTEDAVQGVVDSLPTTTVTSMNLRHLKKGKKGGKKGGKSSSYYDDYDYDYDYDFGYGGWHNYNGPGFYPGYYSYYGGGGFYEPGYYPGYYYSGTYCFVACLALLLV